MTRPDSDTAASPAWPPVRRPAVCPAMACAVLAVAGGVVIAAPYPAQAGDGVAVDRLVLRAVAWLESPALVAGSEGLRGPRPSDHRELPVAEPVLLLRAEPRINASGLADLVWREALAGSAVETPARLGAERVRRVFDTRRH